MQMEHLRYFLTVARSGSISRASRQLLLDQPNLSKIISNLEQDFGTQLFERSSRGVTLTEHGQQLAQWAQAVLEGKEALIAQFSADWGRREAQLKGQLSVVVPVNIAGDTFHEIIIAFSERFPLISVSVEELSAQESIAAVAADSHSVGILLSFDELLEQQQAEEVLFFPLTQVEPVIYAAKSSRFAREHKTTSFSAISKEPIVIYKPSLSAKSSAEAWLERYGEFNVKYTVSNLLIFYSVLKKGEHIALGVARKDPLATLAEMTEIPLRDKILGRVSLIVSRAAIADPLVRAFIQFYYAAKQLPLPEVLR